MLYAVLLGHWLADFVAQSNDMALNKSKSWAALTRHVLAYVLILALTLDAYFAWTWWPHLHVDDKVPTAHFGTLPWFALAFVYAGLNGIAHFVQDAITSRITSRLWFIDFGNPLAWTTRAGGIQRFSGMIEVNGAKRHWFFVMIGFDQLLHYGCLFLTAGWWLR